MKNIKWAAALIAVGTFYASNTLAGSSVEVGFSPEGSARQLVMNTISDAQQSIRMMGYNLTSADIAKALAMAERRGVDVQIILDKRENQNRYSKAALNLLTNSGVKVRLTDTYPIHHDKVIIADQKTVETGSFNYTKAAEYKNSENALVLKDMPEVAQVYLQHWQSRWATGTAWQTSY